MLNRFGPGQCLQGRHLCLLEFHCIREVQIKWNIFFLVLVLKRKILLISHRNQGGLQQQQRTMKINHRNHESNIKNLINQQQTNNCACLFYLLGKTLPRSGTITCFCESSLNFQWHPMQGLGQLSTFSIIQLSALLSPSCALFPHHHH